MRTRAGECIVVTGSSLPGAEKAAETYHIANDIWTTLSNMQQRRKDHGMCAIGSTVYVFFGSYGDIFENEKAGIEFLDLDDTSYWFYPTGW